MPVSPHLSGLQSFCRRHAPHVPKVVFVPRKQAGHTIMTALAVQGCSWVNVRAQTIAEHAAALADDLRRRRGWRPLPTGGEVLIVDALLRAEPAGTAYLTRTTAAGTARSLAETLRTLRLAAVDPEAFADHAATERAQAVAALYGAYAAYLNEHRLCDEAQTYRLALEALDEHPPEPAAYALFDEVDLPVLAARYVRRLGDAALDACRIGTAGSPLPHSAGQRLAGDDSWPRLEDGPSAVETGREHHFMESVGAGNEVRGVLRRIMERGLPLDQVEVAYPVHDPYLSLFVSAADRYDLPVTMAAGLPAPLTRPGQALRGFCSWIEEGLDPQVLIRLLRGGLVRTDRLRLADAPAPHVVAALLARTGAGRGRGAATTALDLLAEHMDDEDERRRIEAVQRVVERLLDFVPEGGASVAEMTARALGFLRLFGPTDLDPAKPAADYTANEHAFDLLKRRLTDLGEGVDLTAPAPLLARRLRETSDQLFVGARAPRPGHLHVVPLSSAGYSGRPHVFVVGMDEATFAAPLLEDPLLLDSERRALGEATGTALPLRREEARATAVHFARAVAGAQASLTLAANRLDLERDRPLARSAAYLDLHRRAGRPSIERYTFVPALTEAAWTLDDGETALVLRHDGEAASLEARYPGAARGRRADAARRGDVLTLHDGWLGTPHAGDDLDLLGGTLSPSRLEAMAACPYRYFLKYVLDVRPPEEAERDEGVCLDRLEQGSLLHDVFDAFMRTLKEEGARPRIEHRERLHALVDEHLTDGYAPRLEAKPAAARTLRRHLRRAVDVFLRAEVAHCRDHEPHAFELSFGLPDDDHEPVTVVLDDDHALRLRGRIDRIDRRGDGTLAIWDYKTGGPGYYAGKDLLQDGRHLQWALYSYAVEVLEGAEVRQAGYFFTSARGAGQRLSAPPADARSDIAALVRELRAMARAACFPPAADGDTCRFCDYTGVCGPYQERKAQMKAKLQNADDHECAEHLEAWRYS